MNIVQSFARNLSVPLLLFAAVFFLNSCKPEVKSAGTLNIRMEAAAKNLNPFLYTSQYESIVNTRIFQTLAGFNPATLELEPMMIKKMPAARVVAEGKHKGQIAYDFEILKEATWDNGSPITANDVLFSMKLVFNPDIPQMVKWRGYYQYLDLLEADPANPKNFTAYLKQYYILNLESLTQLPVLPAYNFDPNNLMSKFSLADLMDESKSAALKEDPNLKAFAASFEDPKFASDKTALSGSGAYRLETMNDQTVELVKKDKWWGDALAADYPELLAYPQRLVYKIVKDDALENLIKTDAIDLAVSVNPVKFFEWKADESLNKKYDFKSVPTFQYNRWQFNLQNPKLSDKRVRQALAHAVDYDYIMQTILKGFAKRTVGPINPSKPYYAKNLPLIDYNLQKAKALLEEAGWKDTDGNGIVDKVIDGKTTDFTLDMLSTNAASKVSEAISNSIQQSLQQIGVKLNIISADLSEVSSKTRSGDFESALYGGSQPPGLVDMMQNYHSTSLAPAGDNRTRIANPHLDSVLTAVRTTQEESRRNELYAELQRIVLDEVPDVYLYVADQRIIVSNKFNYVLSANRPWFYEQMFKLK